MTTALCIYFKVHQPFQLKQYRHTDIDVLHCYADAAADRVTINRLADECYLPANAILHALVQKDPRRLKFNFSISGTALELLQRYRPDCIHSFQRLVDTGCVDILAEPYYHSLSYLYSQSEFHRQIEKHSSLVQSIFNLRPTIFRNTELIYNNQLAQDIKDLGFRGILCEGVESILNGRSCNQLFEAPGTDHLALFLRNANLSDDIAFHFDQPGWSQYPLTAEKFAGWIHAHPPGTELINLFLDYETFGIHKTRESGIFDFLKAFPESVTSRQEFSFELASGLALSRKPREIYDVPQTISWDNTSHLESAWARNVMQNNTLKKIYSLEKMVRTSGCPVALDTWGKLQSADYFYYMNEDLAGGHRDKYPNPFSSAREIFGYYTNIVADFEISLIRKQVSKKKLIGSRWNLLNNKN